jgi:hypothetical protein
MLSCISNKVTSLRAEVFLVGNKKHTNPVIYPPMWCNGTQYTWLKQTTNIGSTQHKNINYHFEGTEINTCRYRFTDEHEALYFTKPPKYSLQYIKK